MTDGPGQPDGDASDAPDAADAPDVDETPGAEDAPTAADAPLGDLRRDIEARHREPDPDVEAVFEEAGTDPVVDGEDVWRDLLEHDDTAGLAFAEQVTAEGGVHVISSRVCHGCPHFGEPPTLHCTHDGTTIRRLVDVDHYEVEDCPVVAARDDLGD